jgi:hypothetical protein
MAATQRHRAGRIDGHAWHLVQGIGDRAVGILNILIDRVDVTVYFLGVFLALDDNLCCGFVGGYRLAILGAGAGGRRIQKGNQYISGCMMRAYVRPLISGTACR